jgi:acetyl esterase/lipase
MRTFAWLALVVASGILVRAEVERDKLPPGVVAYTDLTYRESGLKRLRLDVYVPDQPPVPGGRPVLVAIHGGGWRGGSKGEYGRSLLELTRAGLVVAAVDYRLSGPGSPSWPGNLDDVREAVRWIRRHATEFGIDPAKVAVVGASAGAHLGLLLALDPEGSQTLGPISAVIDFYGPSDLRSLRATRAAAGEPVTLMLGGGPDQVPDRYDAASPVRLVKPGAPPVLIFHGDDDLLVPLDQSRALVEALQASQVPNRLVVVPGARHGFGLTAGSHRLVPEILAFLENVWKAPTNHG